MSDFSDRRSSVRLRVELWVEETTERELYIQRSSNLSEGGIFLENTVPHPVGTLINLSFQLPGEREPIKTRGEIVSCGSPGSELGMGVKFVDLDEASRQRIGRFIQDQEQKGADEKGL